MKKLRKSSLNIRQATLKDVKSLVMLGQKVYGELSLTADMIKSQITHFAEGQLVAAVYAPNTEMIISADLRLESLTLSRNSGTVMNLKDRRFDLYRAEWNSK